LFGAGSSLLLHDTQATFN